MENDDFQKYLQTTSSMLLTNNEKKSETFLQEFLTDFEKQFFKADEISADLSLQNRLLAADKKLNDCSILINHKYSSIIKEFIKKQFEQSLNEKYAIIVNNMEPENVLAEKYQKCFNAFMNDQDSVSFAASNLDLIKNLSLKDYATLIFYAMSTAKRQLGDNCLCLIVSGESSTGKTSIFENPVQSICKILNLDSGCGRFIVESKSIILLHDVNIKVLLSSKDTDKLKAICRTEPVSVKVHSNTICLKPCYILVTSNSCLFSHRFNKPERKGMTFKTFYKSDIVPTRKILASDITAVQKRYLEIMVRQKPLISNDYFPQSGVFNRIHLIKGLYNDIITILFKYKKTDFCSDYLYLYNIISLCKNFSLLSLDQQLLYKKQINELIQLYELSEHQQKQCFDYLNA
jgi:hypothetical protein